MNYVPVIGLEVHAQLLTRTKAFCACPNEYGAAANSLTCPICLGMPGVLPVLNRRMVELAAKLALALGCCVNERSQFARKNYFYPDLPKGYQISQYDQPLAERGAVEFPIAEKIRRVRVRRVHLEEDAGKSLHCESGDTLIDLNRCGAPLIEIVSEPELHSPHEARLYLQEIRRLLEFLEICSGNMEEGALRCDANVSLRDPQSGALGVPTEVKNLNSFRSVQKALEFEIARQSRILDSGGSIQKQTLLWDEAANEARPMRSKELEHDYRYFPEPDLLPLEVRSSWIAELREQMPELPRQRERRLQQQYGLTPYQAEILCGSRELAAYFEATAQYSGNFQSAANFILGEVLRYLKDNNLVISNLPLTPQRLAGLLTLIERGEINLLTAKDLFVQMWKTDQEAEALVAAQGLKQIGNAELLREQVRSVLSDSRDVVARYFSGEAKLFGFLMGQAMKLSGGKADPTLLKSLLNEELEASRLSD